MIGTLAREVKPRATISSHCDERVQHKLQRTHITYHRSMIWCCVQLFVTFHRRPETRWACLFASILRRSSASSGADADVRAMGTFIENHQRFVCPISPQETCEEIFQL
jgi:hypothetical protein